MIGFKYVEFDVFEANADLYLEKAKSRDALHYSELVDARGQQDQAEFPGIYFCASLEALVPWLDDLFSWVNPSGMELLEITAVGDVRKREYENGRIAFVTDACTCRILNDHELTPKILQMLEAQFDL